VVVEVLLKCLEQFPRETGVPGIVPEIVDLVEAGNEHVLDARIGMGCVFDAGGGADRG
jgi:hypothetical protein